MSTVPPTGGQRIIYVPLDHEPEVTQEVRSSFPILFYHRTHILIGPFPGLRHWYLFILNTLNATDLITFLPLPFPALGYLYSPVSLNLIRPENARGVLAAGCLLGGMPELCEHAYEACQQSITQATIQDWLEFVESVNYTPPQNGSASPQVNVQSITSPASVFGPYAQKLRHDVFEYLVVTLPTALNVPQRGPTNGAVSPSSESPSPSSQHGSNSGRDTLLDIFSRVPFDLFKAAIESSVFQIGKRFFTLCYVSLGHIMD